ncbi:hypothetical protein BDB00DRAFT_830435 [Zychaea mexicana]|uniref:uncharacterized protein n=1 Tax=Zychaea mexicana TaxID=64656 RepID=UPI0022FDE1C5|nr:uncharacterized protein BDB00DRAFT_830435 [Zychaea mexicana]KAI9491955.1 hypothetical protein BDB00DRAFT_830435 [Zychaea mexicana]
MSASRLKDRQLLGVAQTATSKEIRRRYIELCKKHHPDVAREPSAQGEPDIRDITAAYRRLVGKDVSMAANTAAAAWQERPPEARKGASPQEQHQWTKWSLFTGVALVTTIVAYSRYEPRKNHIVDLDPAMHRTSWQQQQPQYGNGSSYRQWRKS